MIQSLKYQCRIKSLLLKCIAASLLMHFLLLYFFYKHPLSIYATAVFHKTKPSPTAIAADSQMAPSDNDQILADIFENVVVLPKSLVEPYDSATISYTSSPLAPSTEEPAQLTPSLSQLQPLEASSEPISLPLSDQRLDEELVLNAQVAPLPGSEFHILSENLYEVLTDSLDLSKSISSELSYVETPKESSTSVDQEYLTHAPSLEEGAKGELPSQSESLALLKNPSELIRIPTATSAWSQREIAISVLQGNTQAIVTERDFIIPYVQPSMNSIAEDHTLELAGIATWNDDFTVAVHVSPPLDESGYIFSLALQPKANMALEKIPQNFYFLIDTSSSIDRHRFGLFKRAVLKSLSSLKEGDRFNIILLDKKLSRLSTKNLIFNLKTLHQAEEFLDKHSQSNFITSVDLLDSLEKVAGQIEDIDQMHTALLLTNGQSGLSFQNQQKSLKGYLEKNGNKLALYAAAVGNKNNLVTLDMICNLSGGKLLYSDTNASFPRKFSQLVKSLRMPLAKDVRVTVTPSNPKAGLSLVSSSQHVPALYADEPYLIMGKIQRLSDISLLIEARHDDEWISIQKNVSFADAQLDNKLASDWIKADIMTHYKNFLAEPKAKHIKKAREILSFTHGKAVSE